MGGADGWITMCSRFGNHGAVPSSGAVDVYVHLMTIVEIATNFGRKTIVVSACFHVRAGDVKLAYLWQP